MKRLLTFLLLIVAALVLAFVSRWMWDLLLTGAAATFDSLKSIASTVPVWVWWTIFGISMAFFCPLKAHFFGGRCRTAKTSGSACR